MKCPQDKAGGYAAVTIVLAIVLGYDPGRRHGQCHRAQRR